MTYQDLIRYTKEDKACLLWKGYVGPKGYGSTSYKGKTITTHRLAWVLANGSVPKGLHVLHHCDRPACINIQHLWLGTNWANVRDKIKKGRGCKGEHHGFARLKEHQIGEIKRLYEMGYLQRELSVIYGVERSHISRIINNKKWSYLCA